MTNDKSNKFLNFVAGLLLVAFVYLLLKEFQSILVPLIVAMIVSILFEPFYRWLKSKKIPAGFAIVIVIIVILVMSNVLSLFVITSVNSFQSQLPKYQDRLIALYTSFSLQIETIPYFKDFFKESLDLSKIFTADMMVSKFEGLLTGILGLFGNFVLILLYIVFILLELGSIRFRIRSAFTKDRSEKIADIVENVFADIKKYLLGKTLINLAHAVIALIIFWAFGLDFAIVWAFLIFFMAYIPNIGSFIATLLPFLTALLQYDNIVTPIILLLLVGTVGYLLGNIVEPNIFGHSLNLSPVLLLISLIVWGHVWGIVGMILSVPIISMLKITFSKFDKTMPLAILMSRDVPTQKIKDVPKFLKMDKILKKKT